MNGGSPRREAYDRGSTIFSPDGRLYQVDYAREAVSQGAPVVGVRASDAVVLVGVVRQRSPLLEAESVEKLHAVDDHVGVATAGHVADGRRLVDLARREAQRHRVVYGVPADVETLAKTVTDHVQEATQVGGTRPYGVGLLLAGVDESGPRLFETDPSGTPSAWRATAVGGGAPDIRDELEAGYEDGAGANRLDRDGALELAAQSLSEGVDLEDAGLDAATVTEDGYAPLPDDEFGSILAAVGLDPELAG